ncbi:LysR family transcriptional regulator [Pandoraea sp. CB10b_02]|uniref:LysR family transcriptional regulator n=1 Tax=Pandoraea sp. CB10b_02 TaxID=2014535 RepID=UPI00257BDE5F|nr:LysR family transcriptional regulator [Pandoraea sp. CB10b_02]
MLPSAESLSSRLKLKQLRLLVAIDDYGSLHRAADELALTQPGATKALREIEATFGNELFVRTPQGMVPNELGRCVIRYAKLIQTDVDHLVEEMEGVLTGTGGRLAVGAIMGAVSGVLVDAIARLRRKQPSLRIEITEDTSVRLLALVESGRLELAICRLSVARQPENFTYTLLRDEPLAVIAGPGHPLVRTPDLALSDLMEFGWIVYPRIMPLRSLLEREFKEAGLPLPANPIETASLTATMLLLQGNANLVTLMPRDMAAFLIEHKLAARLDIDVRSRTEPYGIVTRRGTSLSAAARLLVAELTGED